MEFTLYYILIGNFYFIYLSLDFLIYDSLIYVKNHEILKSNL